MANSNLQFSWSLHQYEAKHMVSSQYERCVQTYLLFCQSRVMTPTHIGLNGKGYASNNITEFSAGYENLVAKDYQGLASVSIYVASAPGKDFAFYWESLFHVACSPILGTHFFVGVNMGVAGLKDSAFEAVVNPACSLLEPLTGYGYAAAPETGSFAYSRGAVHTPPDGLLTSEQKELIFVWARDQDSVISGKLRDLYQYNILSPVHLGRTIQGVSLQSWIAANPAERGTLEPIAERNVLWTVPATQYQRIRDILHVNDMLIAYDKQIVPTIFV